MTDERIAAILEAFKPCGQEYKREEVEEALQLREEITSHLLQVLENIVSEPNLHTGDDAPCDHLYALFLLSYFQERRAHQLILRLAAFPMDTLDRLLGDWVTEELDWFLLQTSGGSLEGIKDLSRFRDAYDFARSAALRALLDAVVMGRASRDEVVDFYSTLFKEEVKAEPATEESIFLDLLAEKILEIHPREMFEHIRMAYEDEVLNDEFVAFEDFEEALRDGSPEQSMALLEERLNERTSKDIHTRFGHWFRGPKGRELWDDEAALPALAQPKTPSKAKTKKKKSKRKAARAARKKSRR